MSGRVTMTNDSGRVLVVHGSAHPVPRRVADGQAVVVDEHAVESLTAAGFAPARKPRRQSAGATTEHGEQ